MIFLNYGLVVRDPLIESTYYETIPFFADRCYFPFRYVEGISADKSLKPNIVFILCDDMGYGDLGCYGQNIYRLPILIEWHKKVWVLLKLMPVVR